MLWYNLKKINSLHVELSGYDPFDGLNSKLFNSIPWVRNNAFCRLVWLQFFKRLPFNIRPLVGIKPHQNPKGIALVLSAICMEKGPDVKRITELADLLISLQTKRYHGACWGYPFDWQARAFFQPKGAPTVVATSYVGYALLDAYEITKKSDYLGVASSACDFILQDLNRTYDNQGGLAFSYSPMDKTQVFNATLLGAKLLSRVYSFTHNQHLIEIAKKCVDFACRHQRADGAWPYSPLSFHQWVDSFHTGFNLECISEYEKYSGDCTYRSNIENGLDYYLNHFFTEEGIPKYYDNRMYPIDMHAPAQLVITLYRVGKLVEYGTLVKKVIEWSINNMFDQEKGYFYYQMNPWYINKVCYTRWTQSWMYLALSILRSEFYEPPKN